MDGDRDMRVGFRNVATAFFLISLVGLGACETMANANLRVKRAAFDGAKEAFVPHDNYVAMVLPYSPIKILFDELSQNPEIGPLLNRGEAHVTIVTPPEFEVLRTRLTMAQINRLAEVKKLQLARLEPICIGEGQARVEGKNERTFYVVIKSDDLIGFRREIARLFLVSAEINSEAAAANSSGARAAAAGTIAPAFNPDHFFPHITVGFSKTDLHENQGVIKNKTSCRYSLETSD